VGAYLAAEFQPVESCGFEIQRSFHPK
jgi:hypothetical protein